MVRIRGYPGAVRAVELFHGYEWLGRQLVVRFDTGEGISMQPHSVPGPQGPVVEYGFPMDRRLIYVANLPFSTQWQELKDYLRPAGNILRADVATGHDGRSQGWGTALFATEGDAEQAVNMFDNQVFEGRIIQLRWERAREIPQPMGQPVSNYPSTPSMSSSYNLSMSPGGYASSTYTATPYESPYVQRAMYPFSYQQWQQPWEQPMLSPHGPSMVPSMLPNSAALPQTGYFSQPMSDSRQATSYQHLTDQMEYMQVEEKANLPYYAEPTCARGSPYQHLVEQTEYVVPSSSSTPMPPRMSRTPLSTKSEG